MRLAGNRKRRGITLVEIMIALAVISVISVFFMSSIVFTIKQTKENKDHINALQIMNYQMGLLSVADYTRLGDPALPTGIWERTNFAFRDANPKIVKSDPQDPKATSYRVSFEFSGWGTAQSATDTSLTVTLPSNQAAWTTNQWVGDYVTVYPVPTGRAQIARIISNNANTLTITTHLTGVVTNKKWDRVPVAGERVLINDGKTVTTTVAWGTGSGYRTIQRRMLKMEGR